MSIIVYGPQGSGKTRHAEQLRRHFNMSKVFDTGHECRDHEMQAIYRSLLSREAAATFKTGDTLYLTNEFPPTILRGVPGYRRVIHIADALRQIAAAHTGAK